MGPDVGWPSFCLQVLLHPTRVCNIVLYMCTMYWHVSLHITLHHCRFFACASEFRVSSAMIYRCVSFYLSLICIASDFLFDTACSSRPSILVQYSLSLSLYFRFRISIIILILYSDIDIALVDALMRTRSSVNLNMCVYVSVMFAHALYLAVCLCVCLSVCLSFCLSFCLSSYLPVPPSICLRVYLKTMSRRLLISLHMYTNRATETHPELPWAARLLKCRASRTPDPGAEGETEGEDLGS